MNSNTSRNFSFLLFWVLVVAAQEVWAVDSASSPSLQPIVEIEEEIYTYTDAKNGAGPMWCHGSTCLVRSGDHLFASGLETILDAPPLNNCRWRLWERQASGWKSVLLDSAGRTREPSPLAAFYDGRIFLSANPTLGSLPEPNGGPTKPEVFQFLASHPDPAQAREAPKTLEPIWKGSPPFREHSYRSFAADGEAGELFLMQNIGYAHAEWTFLDREGSWRAQGQLRWPNGGEYQPPQPVRLCYPNVALRNRAVYFLGVSDIVEPVPEWRAFKKELTGREWDYTFRRIYYTWTPDVTQKPFAPWMELANHDATAGSVAAGDLYISPTGEAHLLWKETSLDDRLRQKFFPRGKNIHRLNYSVIRNGKILRQQPIVSTTEDKPGLQVAGCRFQVAPGGRLFVVYYASGTNEKGHQIAENRVSEILSDGSIGTSIRIPLKQTLTSFYTTTPRAGSPPSNTIEMLGPPSGKPNAMSYARVRLY